MEISHLKEEVIVLIGWKISGPFRERDRAALSKIMSRIIEIRWRRKKGTSLPLSMV